MIIVKVSGLKETRLTMDNLRVNIPIRSRLGMKRLCEFGAREYKKSAKLAGINPSGLSTNSLLGTGTRAVKINENSYGIVMPKYGIYQDRMKPHYVSLHRGSKVFRWVQSHRARKVRRGYSKVHRGPRGGLTGGILWVENRPFMEQAELKIRNEAYKIMRREVRRGVRESKR